MASIEPGRKHQGASTPLAKVSSQNVDAGSWLRPANGSEFDTLKCPSVEPANEERPPASHKSVVTKRAERLLEPSLLSVALRESIEIYLTVGKLFAERFALSSPTIRRGQQVFCIGLTGAMAMDLGMTLGVVGATIVLASAAFKSNDHGRAQGILGNLLTIVHTAMLGDVPATVANVTGCLRNVVQAMIPDGRKDARTASAIIGAGVGVGVFSVFSDVFPLLRVENIPMAGSMLFAISGAFPKSLSSLSRVTGLVGCVSYIPYHLSRVEMSIPSLSISAGLTAILIGSIIKNDLLPLLGRGKSSSV